LEKNIAVDETLPLVSVIIPIYNGEAYMSECLDSVTGQSYQNLEIICIDDGSTDKTSLILSAFASKEERMIVISQPNSGAGVSRNVGIDHANGEYIAFIDADDFFENNAIEATIKRAGETGCDILCFGYNYYHESEDIKREMKNQFKASNMRGVPEETFTYRDAEKTVFQIAGTFACTKLWRTSFVRSRELRFSDIRIGEDLVFSYIAMIDDARIAILNEPLYNYRKFHSGNSFFSRKKFNNEDASYLYIFKNELERRGVFNRLEETYIKRIVQEVYVAFDSLDDVNEYIKYAAYYREKGFPALGITKEKVDAYCDKRYIVLYEGIMSGSATPPFPISKDLRTLIRVDELEEKVRLLRGKTKKLRERVAKLQDENTKYKAKLARIQGSRSFKFAHQLRKIFGGRL
jgi:glycosyltransferase EpsH